jgi:hypothetical protein
MDRNRLGFGFVEMNTSFLYFLTHPCLTCLIQGRKRESLRLLLANTALSHPVGPSAMLIFTSVKQVQVGPQLSR